MQTSIAIDTHKLTGRELEHRCLLISQINAYTNYKKIAGVNQSNIIDAGLEALNTGASLQHAYDYALSIAEKLEVPNG